MYWSNWAPFLMIPDLFYPSFLQNPRSDWVQFFLLCTNPVAEDLKYPPLRICTTIVVSCFFRLTNSIIMMIQCTWSRAAKELEGEYETFLRTMFGPPISSKSNKQKKMSRPKRNRNNMPKLMMWHGTHYARRKYILMKKNPWKIPCCRSLQIWTLNSQ